MKEKPFNDILSVVAVIGLTIMAANITKGEEDVWTATATPKRSNRLMDYQDVLILAMKKEKASFHLYTDLADEVENQIQKEIFLSLAQEEAKHKLRFEIEYDNEVLMER